MASELKPCAHCNGAAELDYEQPFCAFPSGKMEKQVAIYCTECDVHMSMCYSDFPEYDHDQMAAILTDKWNTRPAPAATDTGLVTVSPKDYDFYEDGELVTRSQAEELLAAERAKKKELNRLIEVLVKADAAKDARINFLERIWKKADSRAEALEAKLAAANEVLQLVIRAEEDKSGDPNFYILIMQTAYDKARATLGGKP